MTGIPSRREAFAQRACTSELRRSAFHAPDGLGIRSGMLINSSSEAVISNAPRFVISLLASLTILFIQSLGADQRVSKPGVKEVQVPFILR